MFTSLSPYLVNIQSDDPEQNLTSPSYLYLQLEDNTDFTPIVPTTTTHFFFFSFSFFPRYLNIKNVLSVKKIILSFNNSINNNHIGSWKLIMNRQTRSYFVRMIICLSMKDINQNVYLNQKMEVTDGILWWGGGGRIFNVKKIKSTDFWQ